MRLCTFGGLVLEGSDFTRPKPLLLLAYLALEGPQVRRHVAELFWPGARDHMKSLTVALTKLRKGAPGVVEADTKRVWLTVETDAVQFLALLNKGESEQALELYQGPFLEGFYLRHWSIELEGWVYQTRKFLADHARSAMIELASKKAARAHFKAAAHHAEQAYALAGVVSEPEDLARLHTLMLAGNSPKAAEVRKEAEEFDLPLTDSAEAARKRLCETLSSAVSPTAHDLPTRGTAFVGRDLELTEVATLLSQPDCQLVTLVGPAGVGKTRLALQVTHEQLALDAFKDGIYFVSLESLTSPDLIPTALADALGLELKATRTPVEQITAHIDQQQMLLLLDNFEHLMDGAVMLSDLVKACSNLKLFVTSRERLNLEEERIFPVTGLPFPSDDNLTPEKAQHFDAVKLFVRRAKRARPEFNITEDNLPHVLKICRLVEGLPLGLELAAVWVRIMPVHEIASEIGRNLDFLTTSMRNIPERHQSLRSAFEHSWKLLSAKEQEVLRKLSVFKGGFRREAASDVAGATIPVLASLFDKSLLRLTSRGRYDRHPLLYQYTQEKLANYPDEQADAGAKHAAYFLRLAEELRPKLHRPKDDGETGALRILALEYDNLRAALTWSLQNDSALALRLAGALRTFWEIRGYLTEACQWLEAVLAKPAEGVPLRSRFAAHSAYGRFLLLCGHNNRAEEQFNMALELSRMTSHPRDTAEALNHLGLLALERSDYQRAQSLCEQSLKLHRSHDNKRGIAVTLNNLGNIARCQHDHVKATAFYEESLALHREHGIRRSEAIALANLGFVARQRNEIARAEKLFGESITIRHELGDEVGLAHSFVGLAGLMCEIQDYERATRFLGITDRLLEATSVELALVDRSDYERTVATTRAHLTEGDFEKAWAQGYALSIDCAVAN